MKKVLLLLGVVAMLAMASCEETETDAEIKETDPMEDMCACATDMMALGEKLDTASDEEKEDVMKEFEIRAQECQKIGESMEEGKSEEEIDAMKKDFMENCDAVKDMKH